MSKKTQKIKHEGSNYVIINSSQNNRKGAKKDLCSLNSYDPNYTSPFVEESDLVDHIVDRICATSMKRLHIIAQLYAEKRAHVSVQVGGALIQDRSGKSGHMKIDDRNFLTGIQAGHVAIGTYSINGKIASREGMDLLRNLSVPITEVSAMYPAFSGLVADGIFLDSFTQMVPAFINQTSGILETKSMKFMKGLLPLNIPNNPEMLERLLASEPSRIVNMFTEKKKVLIEPIEQRLLGIKHKKYKEYLQAPSDTDNLMFEGRESVFLEQLLALLKDRTGELHSRINEQVLVNALSDASLIANKAEAARKERDDWS